MRFNQWAGWLAFMVVLFTAMPDLHAQAQIHTRNQGESQLVLAAPWHIDTASSGVTLQVQHFWAGKPDIAGEAGKFRQLRDIRQAPTQWQPAEPLNYVNRMGSLQWFHLGVDFSQPLPANALLEVGWPFLTDLTLVVVDRASDQVVYQQRREGGDLVAEHRPLLLAAFPAGSQQLDLYIRAESSAKLLLPLTFWQADAWEQHEDQRIAWLGIMYGALVAMLFYNLFLFVFVREPSYGLYVLYVCSMMIYTLGITGVGWQWVWPYSAYVHEHLYGVSSCLAFLCAAAFIRQFLELPEQGGWMLWVSNWMMTFWAAMTLGYLFVVTPAQLIVEDIGAVISCLIALVLGLVCWNQGNVSGKYVTLAWSVLITSTFLLMLGLSGVTELKEWYQPFQNVGIVFETMLLSMALAERINRERQQRIAAQELSLVYYRRANEAKFKSLEVERQAKLQLEDQVSRRTRELRSALAELETVNAELDSRSKLDGLTGLFNRRHFDHLFQRELTRAAEQGTALSLLMGDLDHFKLLNDRYGHLGGDACLMMTAGIWREVLEPHGGLVARYGGEEIVAILPDTAMPEAYVLAEQVRQTIEERGCQSGGHEMFVTISIGVASTNGSFDAQRMIGEADEALYLAKGAGRNCVLAAHPNDNVSPEIYSPME